MPSIDTKLTNTITELDAINNAVIRVKFSPEGKILSVNKLFAELLNFKESDLIGFNHSKLLFDEEKNSKEYLKFWKDLNKGIAQQNIYRRKNKENNELWLKGTYIPIKNQEGTVIEIIKIAYNITETRNALKTVEDFKHALDESAIVAITDHKGIITYINNKFSEISKYSEKELIGQDHRILNSGHHSKDFIKNLWKTIANGKIWNGEIKNKAKDGSLYWVDTTIVPFLNEKGKPFQYIAIRFEITRKKEILKTVEDLKYALDQTSIIATTDHKGIITYVNDKFSEISKYSEKELIGQDHRILNSGHHSKDFIKNLWKTIANGKIWNGEIKNKAKDGSLYWVDTTIVPFLNEKGKPFQYIAIRTDITERKKIDALKKDKEIAEKSAEAKDVFLAHMSHEIRTPLNAIIGFTSLLKEKSLDLESSKYVDVVSIASKNLMTLINDILDISKIEDGKIELEQKEFDLKGLINDVVKLNSQVAKSKQLKLISNISPEIPDLLVGDPTRLMQILINLIGNSIKFTDEGHIELIVNEVKKDMDFSIISFAVKDTGIGIPQDKLEKVFDRFAQAEDSTTRKYGGTGLGLSIVKMLVELHNSNIAIRSKHGKGTEFSFDIKYSTVDPGSIAKKKRKGEESGVNKLDGIKILIAEDSEFNQLLASIFIKRNNGSIEVVENGKLAVDLVKTTKFDCILMDLEMPVMDGYQASKYIRNVLKLDIPIIACSAHSLVGEQKKSFNVGMNDYITKPYLERELVNKIVQQVKN